MEDYISYIRSRVGHDKIFLNFSAGILADDQGRVLLQLRSDKHIWGIPGGTMEFFESSVMTCKREFLEETGIEVEPYRLLNVYTNTEEVYPNGDRCQSVVFLYEVRTNQTYDISTYQTEETLQLGFFSEEEITTLALSDKHRLMLAEYFANDFKMGH